MVTWDAGDYMLAFEALQFGKAGLLGELMSRGARIPDLDQDDVLFARADLCRWLRSERDARYESEFHRRIKSRDSLSRDERGRIESELAEEIRRETEQRKQTYLHLWRTRLRSTRQSDVVVESKGSKSRGHVVSLLETQRCLPTATAILDFCVLDRTRIAVFVITRDDVESITLQVDQNDEFHSEYTELVMWNVRATDMLRRSGGRERPLRFFYEQLFVPLRPYLRDIETLYLVPHRFLHFLPLHACKTGTGSYLADEFCVAYLPSATMVPKLSAPSIGDAMLTFANPDQGTTSTLPFSEWEAAQVQGQLGLARHQVWVGGDATVDKTENWGQAGLLHFTCHGYTDVMLAATSHLRLADDLLLAHDVMCRRESLRDGSVVVLNGCETGMRDWRAADEGLGMMSAFLGRGASFVLATQWSVDDLCAAEMVTTFLTELVVKKNSAMDSLRAAQRRVRQITVEEVEGRCAELLDKFFPESEFPHEAEKLCRLAQHACELRGNRTGARHYVRLASRVMKQCGNEYREPVSAQGDGTNHAVTSSLPAEYIYDHPLYWGAFQLVGRVT